MTTAEVACAVTRRSGDPTATLDLVTALFSDRCITEHAADATLGKVAAHAGSTLGLRGADACYLALAVSLDARLITLDGELIERAGGIDPDSWLRVREEGGAPD